METAHATRWTLDGDPSVYAGIVAVFDRRLPVSLWWDLKYVHTWAAQRGDAYTYKDWLKKFVRIVGGVGVTLRALDTPPNIVANICTTRSLLTFLWRSASYTKSVPLLDACVLCVRSCVARVSLTLPAAMRTITIAFGGMRRDMHVCSQGSVVGLRDVVQSCFPSHLQRSLCSSWEQQRRDGTSDAQQELLSDVHSVVGVAAFFMGLTAWLSKKKHRKPSAQATEAIGCIGDAIALWLANALDWYTVHVYAPQHDVTKIPPSHSRQVTPESSRRYVTIHPEAAWSILEKTVGVNVSISQVIQTRSGDADAGCEHSQGRRWESFVDGLYKHRLAAVWPHVDHLCITADASNHHFQDCLLGVAFSHELCQGCYPTLQYIVPGKDVYEAEDELTLAVGQLAAERRVERVSAYRQLQALSHMTAQLHRRNFDDYDIPHSNLDAVKDVDERRVVVRDNDVNVAYIANTRTRQMRRVLPAGPTRVPLLVLMLDQGSVGAAGSGFVDHLGKMILMKWEKIHRLINDIKGPLNKCCGAALKAKMYSTYLWSFHSKPFGSGFFGTMLQRALNVFPLTNDIHSEVFQKYLPSVARAWTMPYSTDDEQQAIFDKACDCQSIRNRGEQCKSGRWFSWNASAAKNLPDFFVWKMVLESYLSGPRQLVDPDSSQIEFHDIAAAAKETPKASFLKLKDEGGGLLLAYRMMTHGNMLWCWVIVTVTKVLYDWYTAQTTEIKSPPAMLKYNVTMALAWTHDAQFRLTFAHSLYTPRSLRNCEVPVTICEPDGFRRRSALSAQHHPFY